ncbi:MAG TPA: hypothetical protein DHW71_02220 [Gammaproteobacteria bacterium]|nr:hypothetical protein [Gammaproteobacteria bacterium]HBF10127.1 hypothetical protein [Gammaproteobacteria bacterium]HCK91770.1 hypothetical protein [Gammaproteobacteria bacterium]
MIMPLATQLINPCSFNLNEQPVLVPIPGGPGLSHHIFRPNLDDVAKQIPVLYIDPLGTGQSPAPQTTASYIESCAQALLATLQQKVICRAVLYGHSSGAQIAAQAAVLDTHNRIEHIILSNPVLLSKQTMLDHWTALGGELAHKAIMDLDTNAIDQFMLEIAPLYDTVPRSLEHAMTLEFNKDILINTIHDFLDKDLGTLLQKLPVSFEFFLGVHDPVCRYIPTLDRINTLGITMPVTTFHNSGHDILLSEPEQHNKTILAKVSQIKALQ